MSRLDDAITAFKVAAGDRPFVLVLDRRAATATTQSIEVFTQTNTPTYVARGLLLEGRGLIDAKYPFVVDGDDEDDPDTE